MLPINRLLEYQAEVVAVLLDANNHKMFGYADMIIDDSELALVLKERTVDEDTMFISVMPSYRMKGIEDNAKWDNVLQFFILDKTDYSEHDRDGFRNIFVKTQIKTQAFLYKLMNDKADNNSLFCGFLSYLDENSITVDPVWKMHGCNGWTININLDTAL
jgi:hypothetical protein